MVNTNRAAHQRLARYSFSVSAWTAREGDCARPIPANTGTGAVRLDLGLEEQQPAGVGVVVSTLGNGPLDGA